MTNENSLPAGGASSAGASGFTAYLKDRTALFSAWIKVLAQQRILTSFEVTYIKIRQLQKLNVVALIL